MPSLIRIPTAASRWSLLLAMIFLGVTTAHPQAFGRFGYTSSPEVPGFVIDAEGFSAKHPAADKFRFATPTKTWSPVMVTPTTTIVMFDQGPYKPEKVRLDLAASGFSLYFPKGVEFRLTSTASPYLTWSEGSVTTQVPTPTAPWLALSFRDNQPPVVFGFPDGPASFTVTGRPGAWIIQSAPDYAGWVRVALPMGTQPQATAGAAALGRLAQSAQANEALWTRRVPTLVETTVESDAQSVTATWRFDSEGPLVPRGAFLAELGGYPLKVQSPTRRLSIAIDGEPIEVLEGRELTIRFPIRQIPHGRAVTLGDTPGHPLGTISPLDIPSVAELALENLFSARDNLTRKSADEAISQYLAEALYIEERWTQQKLPYQADGDGIDLAAAHGFLMQALSLSSPQPLDQNSLLTSVTWRQDWYSWLPYVADPVRARRAAALSALAGALCLEPERRLQAAMFQAGLSAERGLNVWRRRRALIDQEPPALEPMLEVRQALFGLRGQGILANNFVQALLSPLRVLGSDPLLLIEYQVPESEEKVFAVRWPAIEAKPALLQLLGAGAIRFGETENLARIEHEQTEGRFEIRHTPTAAGICQVRLSLLDWPRLPTVTVPVPRYSEPLVGPDLR
jgi:hypothetical protein